MNNKYLIGAGLLILAAYLYMKNNAVKITTLPANDVAKDPIKIYDNPLKAITLSSEKEQLFKDTFYEGYKGGIYNPMEEARVAKIRSDARDKIKSLGLEYEYESWFQKSKDKASLFQAALDTQQMQQRELQQKYSPIGTPIVTGGSKGLIDTGALDKIKALGLISEFDLFVRESLKNQNLPNKP